MATIKKLEVSANLVENFKIAGQIRDHQVIIDQPPQGGGKNEGPAPLEFMALSLASCVITVGQVIARQKQIKLRNIEVRVEGEIDVEVFMGKSQENRAGFLGLKILTKIDADLNLEEKKTLLEEIDSRCPVSENLRNLTPMTLVLEE